MVDSLVIKFPKHTEDKITIGGVGSDVINPTPPGEKKKKQIISCRHRAKSGLWFGPKPSLKNSQLTTQTPLCLSLSLSPLHVTRAHSQQSY